MWLTLLISGGCAGLAGIIELSGAIGQIGEATGHCSRSAAEILTASLAASEAARQSEEDERGLARVADDIRSLADQTVSGAGPCLLADLALDRVLPVEVGPVLPVDVVSI